MQHLPPIVLVLFLTAFSLPLSFAAAVTQGTWFSSSHAGWNFTHDSSSFTLHSPCFRSSQTSPVPVVLSGDAWASISFSLAQQQPLLTSRSWAACSLNCSQSAPRALACTLQAMRVTANGKNLSWIARLSFASAAESSSHSPASAACSPLDTGAYAFADPQRYLVLTASAGNTMMNLSCSLVTQSESVAVTDGAFVFIAVDVEPAVPRSPLPDGSAFVVGEWRSDRSLLLATLFVATALSDAAALMQPQMAGLPFIWAPSAVVTLSRLPLPPPSLSACSSPQGGVWGGGHWILNLTQGGGGLLKGDCSSLSVTGAVFVGGASPKLLVVTGESSLFCSRKFF